MTDTTGPSTMLKADVELVDLYAAITSPQFASAYAAMLDFEDAMMWGTTARGVSERDVAETVDWLKALWRQLDARCRDDHHPAPMPWARGYRRRVRARRRRT